jgi:hypothetical protein
MEPVTLTFENDSGELSTTAFASVEAARSALASSGMDAAVRSALEAALAGPRVLCKAAPAGGSFAFQLAVAAVGSRVAPIRVTSFLTDVLRCLCNARGWWRFLWSDDAASVTTVLFWFADGFGVHVVDEQDIAAVAAALTRLAPCLFEARLLAFSATSGAAFHALQAQMTCHEDAHAAAVLRRYGWVQRAATFTNCEISFRGNAKAMAFLFRFALPCGGSAKIDVDTVAAAAQWVLHALQASADTVGRLPGDWRAKWAASDAGVSVLARFFGSWAVGACEEDPLLLHDPPTTEDDMFSILDVVDALHACPLAKGLEDTLAVGVSAVNVFNNTVWETFGGPDATWVSASPFLENQTRT